MEPHIPDSKRTLSEKEKALVYATEWRNTVREKGIVKTVSDWRHLPFINEYVQALIYIGAIKNSELLASMLAKAATPEEVALLDIHLSEETIKVLDDELSENIARIESDTD